MSAHGGHDRGQNRILAPRNAGGVSPFHGCSEKGQGANVPEVKEENAAHESDATAVTTDGTSRRNETRSSSWPRTPAFHAGNRGPNPLRVAEPLPDVHAFRRALRAGLAAQYALALKLARTRWLASRREARS